LSSNQISDISALYNLVNLTTLDLSNNSVKNLEGIKPLINIIELNINNNEITSTELENIIGFSNLRKLYASSNQIDNINSIIKLINLTELDISSNSISDISGISGLTKLEVLNLGNNKLSTNQAKYLYENDKMTAALNNLYSLNVENNQMSDIFTISSIQYMINLKEVNATSNGISKLTYLYYLTSLETLNLSYNSIKNIDLLFKTNCEDQNYSLYLNKLKNISLAKNEISTIYSIQTEKDIDGNTYNKTYSFASFDNLSSLNLSQNKISNISTIAQKSFDSIQLYNQTISLSLMMREEGDDFQEVILPNIFSYTLESSNVYSSSEFSYTYCSKTSEDTNIESRLLAFVDTYSLSTNKTTAKVQINGGNADGTTIEIIPTTNTTTTNGLETIVFSDKNLYKVVINQINTYIDNGTIDSSLVEWNSDYNLINIYYANKGLLAIKELNGSSYKIETVDGIKRLVSLTTLNLSKNNISEIGEISLLANINSLNIENNNINNLKTFKYTLGSANRSNKQVKETYSLAFYKKIQKLIAYSNEIKEIEAIGSCTNLTELNLLQNKIEDISSLSGLTKLINLNLGDNYINSLEAIEKITLLENLVLKNNHGMIKEKELLHLQSLKSLKTLDVSSNYLQDISSLNNIETLQTLYLYDNEITNISVIESLNRLVYLDLSTNDIVDLSGINKFTQLTTLKIKANKINDVTKLEGLNSLATLDISYNRISDITTIENLYTKYNLKNVNISSQKIVVELTEEQLENDEILIELPNILKKSMLSENLVYTSKNFQTSNCTLNENNNVVVSNLGSKIAWVKIRDGLAEDTEVIIGEKLNGTINYSTLNLTNEDVTANITFNRSNVTIKNNNGSSEYKFEQNGEFTFEYEDEYGFLGETTATVNWIDKIAPTIRVDYSKEEIEQNGETISQVTATIISDEELQEVEGWILSENKTILTKIYTESKNEIVTVYDLAGNYNKITVKVTITPVDNTPPVLKISYSTTEKTKEKVTVTIIANEEIQPVTGWIMSTDKTKLVKMYTKNITENITVYDIAGNSTNATITISNIEEEIIIESRVYTIPETTEGYIKNVSNLTTVTAFKNNISTNATNIIVKDTKGKQISNNTYIGTGMTVEFDGTITYTIVVTGDINGDGKITASDLSSLKRTIVGLKKLDGAYKEAGDVNGDGNIKASDLSKLKRMILGLT
jgi:Leucine-rich repeat (LRR) protein